MRLFGITAAILFSLLMLTSCAQSAVVKGTINTQNQVELPAGAIVNVQLQDTSRADAPAIVIGEQVIQNPEQFPISFEVEYDPAQIDERHVYSMRVRIEVEGKLIFINTTAHHVITRGFPTELEVIVDDVATGSPPIAAVGLEDTTWVLASYGEPQYLRSVLPNTEITIEFLSADGSVKGTAGCNSYGGGYNVDRDKLTFPGPLVSTEMACAEPTMTQEMEYLEALQAARTYEIESNQLQITSGDKVVLNFELAGHAPQQAAPAPPITGGGTPLAPTTGEPEPAKPPKIEVAIEGSAFIPAILPPPPDPSNLPPNAPPPVPAPNLPVGTIVIWYNNDSVAHTVTARDNSFDSGNLSSGDTFLYIFEQSGELEYYCKTHPSMVGKITIE
jgi:putative lipoprotein